MTPQFKRRVVPVGSYIIATEELPPDIARSLQPKNRSIADTRRVLTYYRMSPDGKRLIFGGRAKFGHTDPVETAPILYRFMTRPLSRSSKASKITHAWTGNVAFTLDEMPHMGKLDNLHYALGCNGSGVAMMTYLGHPDRAQDRRPGQSHLRLRPAGISRSSALYGQYLVPALDRALFPHPRLDRPAVIG